MKVNHYSGLKARFNFDEWRDRNTLIEQLFLWQFFFKGDEFPNWQAIRVRELGAPPAGEAALALDEDIGEAPRLIQSVWRPSTGRIGAAFSVDSYECSSRSAAHELLIRILGTFQSPLIAQPSEPTVGDVTFIYPGNGIILFARANHAIVVRNLGETSIPMMDLAAQLDKELVEKPPAPVNRIVPSIRSLTSAVTKMQVGSQVPLEIEAALPFKQPLMYKFFYRTGAVLAKEGQLLYQPSTPGEQDLEVYAVAQDRGVGTGKIQFRVRQSPTDG